MGRTDGFLRTLVVQATGVVSFVAPLVVHARWPAATEGHGGLVLVGLYLPFALFISVVTATKVRRLLAACRPTEPGSPSGRPDPRPAPSGPAGSIASRSRPSGINGGTNI